MITLKKFSASWCAPCRALAPVFENEIKPMFNGRVNFQEIDVDDNPEEAIKYNGNIKIYILYIISYIPYITLIIRKYYFAKK